MEHIYRPGDAVHLLHVVPSIHSSTANGSVYYSFNPVENDSSLFDQARQFIEEEFVSTARERDIPVEVVLIKEDTKQHKHVGAAVVKKAEELCASPLVLFAHHKTKFEEIFFGSISKWCAANASCPVLLVHPDHSQVLPPPAPR